MEALRGSARKKKIRELEDEELEPSLREARRLTIAEFWKAYQDDYMRRHHSKRSPRPLEQRDSFWNCHLLPLYGDLTLSEFASLPHQQIAAIPEVISDRVRQNRAGTEGRRTSLCTFE